MIERFKHLRYSAKSNRGLLLNVIASFAVKGCAALVQMALIPAYMCYFKDQTVLGVWFTVISILTWIITFDMGIGNGLRNKLTVALAKNEEEAAKKYISSAYVTLGIFTVVIGTGCLIPVRLLNWNSIFNVSKDILSPDLLTETVTIIFVGVIVSFFLKLISSLLYAVQASAATNLMALLQNFSLLLFLLAVAPRDMAHNLKTLAWANVICMNLPPLIASIVLFSTKMKKMRPNPRYFSMEHAKSTLGLGMYFFVLQILGLIIIQNEILITLFYASEHVVEYQIYNRLFGIIGLFFALAMTPLWSAVTEAIAQKRYVWVQKLYKLVFVFTLIAGVLLFAMIPFLKPILHLWLGENAPQFHLGYAVIMAIFGFIGVWFSAWSTLSYGMNILKPHLITMGIAAFLKIPLTYIFTLFITNWSAIPLAHCLLWLPNAIVIPIAIQLYLKKILKNRL